MEIDRISPIAFGTARPRTVTLLGRRKRGEPQSDAGPGDDYELSVTGVSDSGTADEQQDRPGGGSPADTPAGELPEQLRTAPMQGSPQAPENPDGEQHLDIEA